MLKPQSDSREGSTVSIRNGGGGGGGDAVLASSK